MMYGLLLAVIVLLVVLIAVILYGCHRGIDRVLTHADAVHERGTRHLDKTLDRLMAMDFAAFKAYDLGEDNHGELIEPQSAEEIVGLGLVRPQRGLFGGPLLHEREEDDEE